MTRTKTTTKPAATVDGIGLLPVPIPPVALHDLESVRREMSRIYRAMKARSIDCQDGTRLVYVLTQIGKLIELAEFERRIERLENPVKRLAPTNDFADATEISHG